MDKKNISVGCVVLISLIAFIIMLNVSVAKADPMCGQGMNCDDKDPCTTDYCKNRTECPAGCTPQNCTTCQPTEYYCDHIKRAGCDRNRFVELGGDFDMGTDACQNSYSFDSFDNTTHTVKISGRAYDYLSLNDSHPPEGYKFKMRGEYNNTLYLRINDSTGFLFLEDVTPDCPFKNQCVGNYECNDNDTCTIDECSGDPRRCINRPILYCFSGDGCCPAKCAPQTDTDCRECQKDPDCDDKLDSTTDSCDMTTYKCVHTNNTVCKNGDSLCPSGCTYETDTDCQKPVVYVCGDGKCDVNETKENCCTDCGCPEAYYCSGNKCIQTEQQKVTDIIEKDPAFVKERDKLSSQGFNLSGRQISKSGSEWDFTMTFKKDNSLKTIEGKITNETLVTITPQSKSLMPYILLGFLVLLIITAALFFLKPKQKVVLKEAPKEVPGKQFLSDDESYSGMQESQPYAPVEEQPPQGQQADAEGEGDAEEEDIDSKGGRL